MYYRRKILLAFLQNFGNGIEKIQAQKLLFLFTQGQSEPAYHFVPYKYGCFSFQANADFGALSKIGLIEASDKKWTKSGGLDYSSELKSTDRHLLKAIIQIYGHMSTNQLIEHTYRKYPYFAINSVIARELLTDSEYETVRNTKPISTEKRLFTIGYEGRTLEQYLNLLIKNDVKLLCDVRRNPLSMKYGFNKNQLNQACSGVSISYLHLPEVGINSEWRQELNNQEDYDRLFQRYRNECLPNTISTQRRIISLLDQHQRIALTCFEADICQCHRKHLAESITQISEFDLSLKHL